MDKNLVDEKIGNFGEAKIDFVDGKIVASLEVSPKALLDMVVAKAGPLPQEIAQFLETALGLK